MRLSTVPCLFLLSAVTPLAAAHAQSRQDSASVSAALDRYTRLTVRMASDSIAELYAPDGILAATGRAPIRGPDSIRVFLEKFRDYHVLSDTMQADGLIIWGDTAWQSGVFHQHVTVPAGDTVFAHGRFLFMWVRVAGGEWRLQRASTRP
jgi:ketosteroid isomerase-like protein